eukprot:86633_1
MSAPKKCGNKNKQPSNVHKNTCPQCHGVNKAMCRRCNGGNAVGFRVDVKDERCGDDPYDKKKKKKKNEILKRQSLVRLLITNLMENIGNLNLNELKRLIVNLLSHY